MEGVHIISEMIVIDNIEKKVYNQGGIKLNNDRAEIPTDLYFGNYVVYEF